MASLYVCRWAKNNAFGAGGRKDAKTNRFTWTAEIFIPYELIATFNNVPPQKALNGAPIFTA